MKKYKQLAEAVAPDGTVLRLYRHDAEYIIRANGAELMSTRRHYTEELLAELACAPVRAKPAVRALIGGLGFGFTLRSALRHLAADAHVVVAEIMGAVIDWNNRPDFHLASESLGDPRVELRQGDVTESLRDGTASFDAIMLDVDNGVEALSTRHNAQLYGDDGIRLTVQAMRAGGRLAYWSAEKEPWFEASLRRAGLSVEVTEGRAYGTAGRWHTLYVAHRIKERLSS